MAVEQTWGRRKGNYADYVKAILPHVGWGIPPAKAKIQLEFISIDL